MSAFEQTGPVPSRRRSKSPKPEPRDPVEQFGALLREPAERERAAQDRIRLERQRARDRQPARRLTPPRWMPLAASLPTRSETYARHVERGQESPPPTRRGVKPRPGSSSWRPARRPSGRVTTPPTHRRTTTAPTLPRRSLGSSSRSRSTQRCRSGARTPPCSPMFGAVVLARSATGRLGGGLSGSGRRMGPSGAESGCGQHSPGDGRGRLVPPTDVGCFGGLATQRGTEFVIDPATRRIVGFRLATWDRPVDHRSPRRAHRAARAQSRQQGARGTRAHRLPIGSYATSSTPTPDRSEASGWEITRCLLTC